MSSTASAAEPEFRDGFDPDVVGLEAECDGGRPIEGTHFAGRQYFAGRLTGQYRDYGSAAYPVPWRWYLLSSLTKKPEGFLQDSVWCDADSLFIATDPGRKLTPTIRTE